MPRNNKLRDTALCVTRDIDARYEITLQAQVMAGSEGGNFT
jgi:hypothetical protein